MSARLADLLVEAEARGEPVGRQPVCLEHFLGVLHASAQEPEASAGTTHQRAAGADVAQHERHVARGVGEVHPAEVGLERHLVAEPFGLLVRVDVAADPRHQAGVVDGLPFAGVETDLLAEPAGNQALPECVLHRLAHPEIAHQR